MASHGHDISAGRMKSLLWKEILLRFRAYAVESVLASQNIGPNLTSKIYFSSRHPDAIRGCKRNTEISWSKVTVQYHISFTSCHGWLSEAKI